MRCELRLPPLVAGRDVVPLAVEPGLDPIEEGAYVAAAMERADLTRARAGGDEDVFGVFAFAEREDDGLGRAELTELVARAVARFA